MFEACVVGCGQIGTEVLKALTGQRFTREEVIGTDISAHAIERLEAEGFRMTNSMCMPEAKVYFICVWNTSDVQVILEKLIDKPHIESIFIETTIDPSEFWALYNWICDYDIWEKIVFFPHRFNPNDIEHHIFNQKRLFGPCGRKAEEAGMTFLRKVMNPHLIEYTGAFTAVLAKVVENAYRAMEIILAQEIKDACETFEGATTNFEQLIQATNTKWNINIKEARDGVKGKCLPKDLALYNKFFKTNALSRIMEMMNNDYIARHKV